jgi:hypothetical protein
LPTSAAEAVPIKHAIYWVYLYLLPSVVWGCAKLVLKHAAYSIHLLALNISHFNFLNVHNEACPLIQGVVFTPCSILLKKKKKTIEQYQKEYFSN